MTSALSIEGLTVALPKTADRPHAVEEISLVVPQGKTLCIVGESGSGKSVIANTVMGLLPSSLRQVGGRVLLDGEDLTHAPAGRLRQLRGAKMGMVFQEPMTALNPIIACGAQVDELLRHHTDLSATDRRARILKEFERVRLPDPARVYASYPHQLSGGQRQRIVIAIATILRPKLLICDEPTTALDVTTQNEILNLIREMQDRDGQGVLFITHDMGVVANIADQVMVMKSGKLVESGLRDDVLMQPAADYTRMLLERVPSLTPRAPRQLPSGPDRILASGLAKKYGPRGRELVSLDHVRIAVGPGEAVGIVGESGSGKTTLARCVARIIEPSAGSLRWKDREVQALSEGALRPLRRFVQVVFQDPNRSLNPRLTAHQSIVEGAINFGASKEEAGELAKKLMQRVGLSPAALKRYPSEFSGGQRQRLAIARALACKPDVLIADEAVSALDVSVQAEVIALLREIQTETGLSMIFITHDLRVAAQLCDRIVVMQHGKIVEDGPTAGVFSNPQHHYTQTLLAASPQFRFSGAAPVAGLAAD